MIRARTLLALPLCAALLVVAGCASRSGGGYYKDDGPGRDIPANILSIPDAVPRVETHAPANFRPYVVFGQRYVPIGENQAYRQTGIASWYGRKFHGQKTANGETYDMYAMTAAHPTLPLPSYARVTRAGTGRSVIVRINDRGPFHSSRVIDLSYVAAAKLGLIGPGSGQVIVEAITNNDILSGRYARTAVAQASPPPPPAAPPPVSAASQLAPAAAPAPRQTALYTAHAGGIYLQFGAFSSQGNAHALAQRVNRESGGLLGTASVVYDSPLYKVRTGPYDTRTEAVNAAYELSQATGLQASIAVD
ncbi:septal ring lytic transglycosylase RlpA family protein [Castellaniella sp. GW247-6E4]|uniref:septal ring lytic transglycosylase RlpA family protein n=1 Tax=Castellaniella sp. GW247-6E4 TaxID=3140380 RepID=UPI0033151CF6